jgi:hypothetical protein
VGFRRLWGKLMPEREDAKGYSVELKMVVQRTDKEKVLLEMACTYPNLKKFDLPPIQDAFRIGFAEMLESLTDLGYEAIELTEPEEIKVASRAARNKIRARKTRGE